MRVLVTGGTGFTGSHLTRRLLQRGHEVIVLDNQPGLFCDELRELGAQVHIGSVTDADLVDRCTRGCEVIHHVAAMFRKVNQPKQAYWNVNVEGTRILMEAALRHGVRKVVNCSTQGVHGHVERTPGDENIPIAPADWYQATKYEGEKVANAYAAKGIRVLTLRPTAIYGPGDPGRFLILFRMVNKGRFWMCGSGTAHYHPVYIGNLVDAFELAAESPRGDGESYIIGDEHYYTLTELVTAIAAVLGVDLKIRRLPFWPLWTAALACELIYKPLPMDPPLFRRRVDWFRQNRAFSIERARSELGYEPAIDLKEGLTRTAAWYRENGYLPAMRSAGGTLAGVS
jgi:nucleoside-diphosphate-sugar epimerase